MFFTSVLLTCCAFHIPVSDADLELPTFSRRGPTCGIRSLYVALKSLGARLQYESLVSKVYVSSEYGSSAKDLISATRKQGFVATSVSHFSTQDLRYVDRPMLLHMRSSGQRIEFDHWVVYLGWENENIRIFDPTFGESLMEPAHLMSNWSGSGLVISREQIDGQFLLIQSVLTIVSHLVVCSFVVLISRKAFTNRISKCGARTILAANVLAVLTISLGLFVLTQFFSLSSFFRNPEAVAEVSRRHFDLQFDTVDKAYVADVVAGNHTNGQGIIIDARRSPDYRAESIPGAISVPVNSSLQQRIAKLSNVLRSDEIIVFCQSNTCGYSDEIAHFLKFNGFKNVKIYRGGFADWTSEE